MDAERRRRRAFDSLMWLCRQFFADEGFHRRYLGDAVDAARLRYSPDVVNTMVVIKKEGDEARHAPFEVLPPPLAPVPPPLLEPRHFGPWPFRPPGILHEEDLAFASCCSPLLPTAASTARPRPESEVLEALAGVTQRCGHTHQRYGDEQPHYDEQKSIVEPQLPDAPMAPPLPPLLTHARPRQLRAPCAAPLLGIAPTLTLVDVRILAALVPHAVAQQAGLPCGACQVLLDRGRPVSDCLLCHGRRAPRL